MKLAEVPRQEIHLLKEAFQLAVKESRTLISGLTLYTAGYLHTELVDDEIIGPRWKRFQETRLNVLRLQSEFFQTIKRLYSRALVLTVLETSPGGTQPCRPRALGPMGKLDLSA